MPSMIDGPDYRTDLLNSVSGNDAAKTRALLEKRLWSNDRAGIKRGLYDVSWLHLKLALEKENADMVRLLAAYGARVDDHDFAHMTSVFRQAWQESGL